MTNQTPVIAGVEITTDHAGRFNLNALHRASGGEKHRAPNEWLRTASAQELVTELTFQTGDSRSGENPIDVVRGGNTPGTFAHELLAISYAGWISPRFQLQVNQVFLDYRTGKLAPAVEPLNSDPRLDDIARSLRLGLIDQAEATRRAREILDGKAPTKPKAIASPSKPKRWPLAEWSGESIFNLHEDALPTSELKYWVKGGEAALIRALVDGGFLTENGRPGPKGAHLVAGKRNKQQLFKARSTLEAIGAWPN